MTRRESLRLCHQFGKAGVLPDRGEPGWGVQQGSCGPFACTLRKVCMRKHWDVNGQGPEKCLRVTVCVCAHARFAGRRCWRCTHNKYVPYTSVE